MNYVNYDDFKKMDMRFGLIRFVEPVEGTDKLLRFEIDFGSATEPVITCAGECKKETECEGCEEKCVCTISCDCEPTDEKQELPFGKNEYEGRDIRQIVSGIKEFFPDFEELVGKYGLYILNLEPREIRGVMSNGMLMAVDGVDGAPVFVEPRGDIEPGSKIR